MKVSQICCLDKTVRVYKWWIPTLWLDCCGPRAARRNNCFYIILCEDARSQLHVHYPSTDTETNILFSMDGTSLIAWQWDLVAADPKGQNRSGFSLLQQQHVIIIIYYYSLRILLVGEGCLYRVCFAARVRFSATVCSIRGRIRAPKNVRIFCAPIILTIFTRVFCYRDNWYYGCY